MDLNQLELKAGLEVHQQLDTGKLFCRCPIILHENEKPDFVFERQLRPVASELGEFDKAALEAFQKKLVYEYHGFHDSCCLREADEEPVAVADEKAFETVLQIALMCNAEIFNSMHVMRKTVIDGSNTSGFQRTMLVSHGGKIVLKNKEIGVQAIVLEEDSARPLEKTEGKVVYNLDRLGIPLIELATDPDLKTPEEVKECALKIGELMRRTCSARRGLGTIRQDLNISIKGGARIELKGVQELEMIDEFVRREMQRQAKLLELKEELENRGIVEELDTPIKNLSAIFGKTQTPFISSALKEGKRVLGAKIPGFAGLLGLELQPGRRFGTELSDYVKARSKAKGIIHSDENLAQYKFTEQEVNAIKTELGIGEQDAFVLVVENEKETKEALLAVNARCFQAWDGVPNETRNALEGGNSSYSRPLPGAARMYPETDLKEVQLDKTYLAELKKRLPLTLQEREKLYKGKGLSGKLVDQMKLNNWACFFESMLSKGFDATLVASLLLDTLKQLEREKVDVKKLGEKELEEVLIAEKTGVVSKDVLLQVLKAKSESPTTTVKEIVKSLGMEKVDSSELEAAVKKVIVANEKIVKEKGLRALGALMGDVMKEMKGKASGKDVSEMLKKELSK